MRAFLGLLMGLLFGLGLIIADMTNPAKVLAFLDILDGWDPSLALVMASGVAVYALGFWRLQGRNRTPLGLDMRLPQKGEIDRPLVLGSVLFGLGWGLVGLCPGPAVTGLLFGGLPLYLFTGAMLGGMVLHRLGLER